MNPPDRSRLAVPPIVGQLVRYGAVGVANTLIGFGIYAFCADLLGIQYEVSLAIAYVIGAVNGYLLNRHWTFSGHDADHSTSGGRYAAVQVGAFLTNLVLLHTAVAWLGVEKNIAQAVIVPLVFGLTFVPNRLWSFAHRAAAVGPVAGGSQSP
ncbi:MAG TPA: GtrA family protein [Solirubrobacteraceae bacterium]|jgi:putative flippase GtrA|nr:GtrA family protein [Solirubrobacteraceae bacterium]